MGSEMNYPEVVRVCQGPFTLEMGRLARQSDGAVLVHYGETMILATVNRAEVEENIDYFPLIVDYEEKFYAGGKIPGGFLKREGRPSEEAILNARMIDRPIRPLFPEHYREKVHVVVTVLSADKDHAPEIAGMLGASITLMISSVPFDGPVAGVRVGQVDGRLITNPTAEQREQGRLDIIVAGTEKAVTMVEGAMKEVPEDQVIEAVQLAHEEIKKLIALQKEFIARLSPKKVEVTPPEGIAELKAELKALIGNRWEELRQPMRKLEREALADHQIRDEAIERLLAQKVASNPALSDSEREALEKKLKGLFAELLSDYVRKSTLERKVRMDGRRADELRPIRCEVGILPRVHG